MVLWSAHVQHFGSTGMPYRKISITGQQPSLSPQRRNQPDITAIGSKFIRGPSDLDDRTARGACGYECDPVPVRRECGLDVLARIVAHIDFLSALEAAHIDLVVPAAI